MNILLGKRSNIIVLTVLAIIFFFVYSYLSLATPLKFNSPDETANYFFTKLYTETGQLTYSEPLESVAENIIHPRSTNVVNNNIVPGSFLGMILLYGWIAKIFGVWIILFLTPFFAASAVLFFYGLIQRIFDQKIAFFSSLLLFITPPFWYYASRGLTHNLLFVSLLIIGFYFLIQKKPWIIFSSLFIGLALTVRTVEIGWVGLVLLILWWSYRKKIKLYQVIMFLAVIILTFLPIFYHQQVLYGHPFATGYNRIEGAEQSFASLAKEPENSISTPLSLIIPFGLHPITAAINFYKYYVWLFWYLAIPAILGSILAIKKKLIVNRYLLIVGLASLWLIIFYGSWAHQNLPDPNAIGLASSYVRYWLPIYIISLPFVVVTISSIKKRKLLVTCYLLLVIYGSLASITALAKDKQNIVEYKSIADSVIQQTEKNSVILTERSDKVFFPERRVIVYQEAEKEKIFHIISKLIELAPIYYYTPLEEKDIEYLRIKFSSRKKIGGMWLYTIKPET